MTTTTNPTPFIDRRIGTRFQIHAGSDQWLSGVKVGHDEFKKDNDVTIGVSAWTKTKDEGRPLIEIL